MRLLHTADLHIGKIVNDFSMLEDQKFILEQIKNMAIEKKADGVLLAGDIYDRAIPAGEAVLVFDSFLTGLVEAGIQVYYISGNHDSAERLSFGEELFAGRGVGIGGVYKGELPVFCYEEKWGCTEIVLLPFIKPAQVNASSSGEAVEKLLCDYREKEKMKEAGEQSGHAKTKKRRVLVTHYFVTDAGREPELSDSETTVHIGGLDQVEASLFEGFDYVALGHIHKTQQIGERPVWYAGSPLKYSFGEVKQTKHVLFLEIGEAGLRSVEKCPLRPIREMRKVKGQLSEIMESAALEGKEREDYMQAVLTDEDELIDPMGTLRSVYPNMMQIVKAQKQEKQEENAPGVIVREKDPLTLFSGFYQLVKDEELGEEEKNIMLDIIKQTEG